MKALLAVMLIMPMTMSSVVASEKEEFNFKLNDQGKWCGKFYSNRWSTLKTYSCKTQKQWEKLGITFPEHTPQFKKVVIGEPILGGDSIRG